MRLERHRSVPGWAEAELLSWLPRSELAVSLRARLGSVGIVVDVGAVVAVGFVVEGTGGLSLSGAEVMLACAGDPHGAAPLAGIVEQEARAPGGVEVGGPAPFARGVADALAQRSSGAVTQVMAQRLMAATEAVAPSAVPGRARRLRPDDGEVVARWLDDFTVEALGHERRGIAAWRERVAEMDSGLWVWEDERRPVSLVNARPTTPVSSRIGPVYTPPAERGHGYAAALVAAVTDACLAQGDDRVTLFTDVANPTSNALYARVGYADVCAHDSWLVEA